MDRTEHIDCEGAKRQLWDYLDGELTPERMTAIRAHLHACRPCACREGFERAFLQALATARADATAPPALRERVLSLLRDAGFSLGK